MPRGEQRSRGISGRVGGPVQKQWGLCSLARREGFGLLFPSVYFFLLEGKLWVSVAGQTRELANGKVRWEMPKVRGLRARCQAVGWEMRPEWRER